MKAVEKGQTALVEYAASTITGSCREANEDTFGILEEANTYLVVDGCGGASSGENAAILTVTCFEEVIRGHSAHRGDLAAADLLAAAVIRANEEVFKEGQTNPKRKGQGAALCALRMFKGWIAVAHVGDCRVGRYRDGSLTWLTEDHSLVAEMRKSGAPLDEIERIAETHSTVITRAVGVAEDVPVDLSYHPSRSGDLFLLCSDGVTRQVAHTQVAELLGNGAQDLGERCAALLDASEAAGGHDNATAILAQIRQ
ncbi:MAG: protein phosphatase 2C domain-containing protein [bacterium]